MEGEEEVMTAHRGGMNAYRKVPMSSWTMLENPNEIRVTSNGAMRNFVNYALKILKKEENTEPILLVGLGRSIAKVVTIAEIVKAQCPGLHQIAQSKTIELDDKWEALVEGLDTIETRRQVSGIFITLSFNQLDTTDPGYQEPNEVTEEAGATPRGGRSIGGRARKHAFQSRS